MKNNVSSSKPRIRFEYSRDFGTTWQLVVTECTNTMATCDQPTPASLYYGKKGMYFPKLATGVNEHGVQSWLWKMVNLPIPEHALSQLVSR